LLETEPGFAVYALRLLVEKCEEETMHAVAAVAADGRADAKLAALWRAYMQDRVRH
jgi:hypothetical protein